MGERALIIKTIGHGQVLGMIGNGHVFVSTFKRGLGHFFDGVAAIGFDGVHVHVALDVLLSNQLRQAIFFSGFDLATVLAQLWWYVFKPELLVDLRLSFSGYACSTLELG